MYIDIIYPTHPHLSSVELLNVLLGSGMEVFTHVSQLPPPLCCRYEEDNPTLIACQALEQAMCGIVAHPHLSSLQPPPNVFLSSCTEVFIPVPHVTPSPCYRSEEDNLTPTACQALEQETWGTVVFPPHQPPSPLQRAT